MPEATTLLAVTIVVMSAGSTLYTIKTLMRPGTTLNVDLDQVDGKGNLEIEDNVEMIKKSIHHNPTTVAPLSSSNVVEVDDVESTTRMINKMRFNVRKPMKPTRPSEEEEESSVFYEPTVKTITTTLKPTTKKPRKRSVVDTKMGSLEGLELEVAGKRVWAFLGIKYAQPPVGDLRFRPPLSMKRWDGIKQVKEFGSACIQIALANKSALPITLPKSDFSEDCLHLNIWTPSTKKPLKAVLFFIHGGFFTFGSNTVDEQDGRMLASYGDVVVVSVNYRMGPFGFMTAANDDVPGNMGLQDILLALKWVKSNIDLFGGDPRMITIIGHQAGAMAANMFMLSSETRHLFRRAILQSGSAAVFNLYFQKSLKSSEKFAQIIGCADDKRNLTNDPETVMQCIRNMPLHQLKKATEEQLSEALYSFSPVVGDEIFPKFPKDLMEDDKLFGDQKEVLVGTNSDEGALFFHLGNPELFRRDKSPVISDLDEAKQLLMSSLKDFGFSKKTFSLMSSFFLEKTKSLEPRILLKALHDVFGDLAFVCPSVYFSEKFSEKNRTAYFYYYTHRSSSHHRSDWFGTTHFDEIPFVFGYPLRYPHKYSGSDIDFSKVIMLIWTTFAKTGKPPAVTGREWPQYSSDHQEYVELNGRHLRDGRMSTGFGPDKENCDTWKYVFKLFN